MDRERDFDDKPITEWLAPETDDVAVFALQRDMARTLATAAGLLAQGDISWRTYAEIVGEYHTACLKLAERIPRHLND